jgi:hypothetical protein
VSSQRLSLDLGLRASDLFFRELVVPELGRIWFARQLSWPLAALALHEELAHHESNVPKPTAICHGIEALACKLEYLVDPQNESRRILGRRAFDRDAERGGVVVPTAKASIELRTEYSSPGRHARDSCRRRARLRAWLPL